jgi:hypothetical protein
MARLPKSITLPGRMFRQPKGVLRNIFDEAAILLDIQAAVKEVVRSDIQVAGLNDGELHLVTPSAAIATRIKYSQKSIIGILKTRRGDKPIKTIRISVRPIFDKPERPDREALPPNAANARQLEAAADHVSDPELKEALRRLAARGVETESQSKP